MHNYYKYILSIYIKKFKIIIKYIIKYLYLQIKSINNNFIFPTTNNTISNKSFKNFNNIIYNFTKNKILL